MSLPFNITKQDKLIYLIAEATITKEHLPAFDEIIQTIENDATQIHVFDMSSLQSFDSRCLRPFILAQNAARSKQNSHVVIIQPEDTTMKKFLLDQAAIRPKEICPSKRALPEFLKRKSQEQKTENTDISLSAKKGKKTWE